MGSYWAIRLISKCLISLMLKWRIPMIPILGLSLKVLRILKIKIKINNNNCKWEDSNKIFSRDRDSGNP